MQRASLPARLPAGIKELGRVAGFANDDGASLIEYAIVLGMITFVSFIGLAFFWKAFGVGTLTTAAGAIVP